MLASDSLIPTLNSSLVIRPTLGFWVKDWLEKNEALMSMKVSNSERSVSHVLRLLLLS